MMLEAGSGWGWARQTSAVWYKNLRNHLSHKKKLLSELGLPLLISAVYALDQKMRDSNPLVGVILGLLLKIYLGLVLVSAMRELITLFITERTEQFRQYQMICGLTHRLHTLSNLTYMWLYLSACLLPIYLTVSYFRFDPLDVFYFGSFVISFSTLTLALTAFFKDHKIALELIGMLFSLSAFLPFLYEPDADHYRPIDYLAMVVPNSAFTIALLHRNTHAALLSLFFAKFYFILYSILEFPDYYADLACSCWAKVGQFVPIFERQPTNLMEEFELNEIVNSELEQNSMLQPRRVAIKTEALVKTYAVNGVKVNALNSLSLTIHRREIYGLLGRNGAGKTTLVDILTGVTKPTLGNLHMPPNTTIGICYQHEVLYENLTVDEHLYFYSHLKELTLSNGQTRQQHVEDIIRKLGMEGERDKRVKELSGGNKRKLSIAIAILGSPQLLIFDEPTSGLDPLSRMNVWDILAKLREIESTIILTTHHLDEAERLSDWISVIEKGSVVVTGTADNIKEKYGRGYHLALTLPALPTYSQIDGFKALIQAEKLRAVELEHINCQINFLVKPQKKESSSVQFEQSFIALVQRLEQQDNVQMAFHSNTLEESFIAILRDTDNSSGDSLNDQGASSRDSQQLHSRCWLSHFFFQIVGVILKNIYYHKSIFLQSVILYNINILVVLISVFFNTFVTKYLSSENPVPSANSSTTSKATILLQGYIIMATAFISGPVYEKEKRIRSVMTTRGLGGVTYWLGNFIFDMGLFCLNLLVVGLWVAAETVQDMGWLNLIELGVGIILFTYCFSFVFDKMKSASTWFSVANMVLGFIIMPMILFGQETFFRYLDFFKYLYPYYDLNVYVFFKAGGDTMAALSQLTSIKIPQQQTILINIVVYFLLLIALESELYQRIREKCSHEDRTVAETVKLEMVSKNYGHIEALKEVTYAVSEERLALLGHNGAGKSTTFGLLSGQLTADSGQVYLEKQLRGRCARPLARAGICYQDDSLWEGVLVHEIQRIFSYMVPISNSDRQLKWLTENLQFDSANTYKRFSSLSGGNKRKLCMMVALYGDPQMRLLDECSTGLDPSSRLAMVETVKHSPHGTTVFTTHSMSEAETLCTRAVIMSKGQVLQNDYIPNLRSKHFDCSWIDLRLGEDNEEFADIVRKEMIVQGGKVINTEKTLMRVQVQKKEVKMSRVLRVLQNLKKRGVIGSYSNVEPRLEDVYIKVTREDRAEGQAQQLETAGVRVQNEIDDTEV